MPDENRDLALSTRHVCRVGATCSTGTGSDAIVPSEQEMLLTIKGQTLAMIAELTASPKPSYAIDGQSVSWAEYLDRLKRTVAWCNEQLAVEDPFEFQSQGST